MSNSKSHVDSQGTSEINETYLVTRLVHISNPNDEMIARGELPVATTPAIVFVYSIQYYDNRHESILGDIKSNTALVAAKDSKEALRMFRSALFMASHYQYEVNFERGEPLVTLEDVKVFCQASTNQIGRVQLCLQ